MLQNRNDELETVVRELLRSLRGKRSQLALSRRLGYSFNQVGKWESGHTKIRWDEFVRLSGLCKSPLDQALTNHYKYKGTAANCDAIIKNLIGSERVSTIAKKTGFSRHSLAKWLKKSAFPTVPEMFRLLLLYRGGDDHLVSFIGSLVSSIDELPSIAPEYRQRVKQIELSYQHPWLAAVKDCLSLQSYQRLEKHREGFVSRCLRISTAEEKMALDFLTEVGVLTFSKGKYQVTGKKLMFQENILDKEKDIEGNFRLREYWWSQALNHLISRPAWSSLTFAFQTFTVSESAFRKIRALSVQYFSDVTKIIEEDEEPRTLLRVMNLCFFDPSGL